ncbi:MAG: RraA family protein [Kiloniellales bacterium]
MDLRHEIISLIRHNRISTTEVADALGKAGVLPGVHAITPNQHRVGTVRPVFTAHDSNYAVHEQVRAVEEGDVVVVFSHGCEGRAILGDLISKYILLYRGAEALVVDGLVRDAARLTREGYPIWAAGVSPLGCFNRPADPFPPEREQELRRRHEGGVAVCDGGGVVIIPPDRVGADMLERLERIELQEDVWYYCLDTLKWDTKRIVCDKAYLSEPNILPEAFAERVGELAKPFDKKPDDD